MFTKMDVVPGIESAETGLGPKKVTPTRRLNFKKY